MQTTPGGRLFGGLPQRGNTGADRSGALRCPVSLPWGGVVRISVPLALLLAVSLLPACYKAHWSAVAYGDSLTSDPNLRGRKWCGPKLQAPRTCIPRGVGGERTAEGVARLLSDLSADDIPPVDYVILAWGANDIGRGGYNPQSDVVQPLRGAAQSLLADGFTPVLWTPLPWMIDEDPLRCCQEPQTGRAAALRPLLDALGRELGIPVIDGYSVFAQLPEVATYYADPVHLSTTPVGHSGQDVLAAVTVLTLDFSPR
jgi:lysophospholipase L1-like esterase